MPYQRPRSPALRYASRPSSSTPREWLDSLLNYERRGIPKNAGTRESKAWDTVNVRAALSCIGQPQRALQRVVHVVGSKGKGTTARLIAAGLQAQGYRVGCYTSPHLLQLEERIAVGAARLLLASLSGTS